MQPAPEGRDSWEKVAKFKRLVEIGSSTSRGSSDSKITGDNNNI